ncbi:hypothetical protein GYMLUDRAFT_245132 [Collybiopsis luxurians FD-317 M1]|uniref:Uncharacterized protein n=1 Tax=Collybiopsis luxurians FD-317 M1 TaxID=944289 RepID=A0A0D0CUF1_9AGAR|nr:hypothetical protein GYMLUDRAFT_245132 [Collybiopsis luxurians FD-317 M1]
MVGGDHPYILIIVFQLFTHFLAMLNTHPALLVVWLPLSLWISLWRLRRYIAQTPSSSLPVHNSQSLIDEDIGQSIILVFFLNAWLTLNHLFAVIVGSSPSWWVIAFTTLFLVTSFAQYLEFSAIPKYRWGYFFLLYRIVVFAFHWVYAILWIVDLCEGRIELFRRRES